MQNKLSDLNNHLFAEMERLGNEELVDDELMKEIDRAKAVSQIATQIIANANVVLKATIVADDHFNADFKLPKMLMDNDNDAT